MRWALAAMPPTQLLATRQNSGRTAAGVEILGRGPRLAKANAELVGRYDFINAEGRAIEADTLTLARPDALALAITPWQQIAAAELFLPLRCLA
jgi:hypothetical protein